MYYISHSGIKGMHWGVRRFQNEDGSLTAAGRARYGDGGAPNGSSGGTGGTSSRKAKAKKALKIAAGVAVATGAAYGAYRLSKHPGVARALTRGVNEIRSRATDAYNAVRDRATDTYNTVRDRVTPAYNSVRGRATNLYNRGAYAIGRGKRSNLNDMTITRGFTNAQGQFVPVMQTGSGRVGANRSWSTKYSGGRYRQSPTSRHFFAGPSSARPNALAVRSSNAVWGTKRMGETGEDRTRYHEDDYEWMFGPRKRSRR